VCIQGQGLRVSEEEGEGSSLVLLTLEARGLPHPQQGERVTKMTAKGFILAPVVVVVPEGCLASAVGLVLLCGVSGEQGGGVVRRRVDPKGHQKTKTTCAGWPVVECVCFRWRCLWWVDVLVGGACVGVVGCGQWAARLACCTQSKSKPAYTSKTNKQTFTQIHETTFEPLEYTSSTSQIFTCCFLT
jgi:hypothetical protein